MVEIGMVQMTLRLRNIDEIAPAGEIESFQSVFRRPCAGLANTAVRIEMDQLEDAIKKGHKSRVEEFLSGNLRPEAADFINLLRIADSDSVYQYLLNVVQKEEYAGECFGQALLNKYNAVKEKQKYEEKKKDAEKQKDEQKRVKIAQDIAEKQNEEKRWLKIAKDILSKNDYLAPFQRADGTSAPVWKQGHALHYAADMWCPEVVQQLLDIIRSKHADNKDDLFNAVCDRHDDKTPLITAIRKADLETVKILVNFEPGLLDQRWHLSRDTPLHAAIEYFSLNDDSVWPPIEARHEIIDWIVEYDPSTLCKSNERIGKGAWGPPYCYAENLVAGSKKIEPELQKLRERLRHLILRRLEDASMVDQALSRTGDTSTRKLHELDLSDFDYQDPAHTKCDFAQFVDTFKPKEGLEFDSELIRVQLPDMSRASHREGVEEIVKLLTILRREKVDGGFGVERIIQLNALDNTFHPIGDEIIALLAKAFKVEKLNWYKYDLDLDVLKQIGANLRKLWLYSSGNWGTLFYWTSVEGLLDSRSFPQLEEAHIIIVDADGTGRTPARQNLVNRVNTRIRRNNTGNISINVTIEEAHRPISYVTYEDKTVSERFFDVFNNIHMFLESIEKGQERVGLRLPQRRIKIAIIDNGIDKWQDTISENIKEGFSYASRVSGKLLPWFTAAHAHGTNMASLVRKINPYCELYIYRVSSLREGMDPKCAIKAIEAAHAAGVDIMNLSWTFEQYSKDLEKAIADATDSSNENCALILCATSDEPHNVGPIYPADFDSTISVCAANSRGRRFAESRKTGDLMILGEGIDADGPSYFKQPKDSLSGSSAATALATGIASVLLIYAMCAAPGEHDWKEFKQRKIMLKLFKEYMTSSKLKEDNYVDPYRLFGKKLQPGLEGKWGDIFDSSKYR